MRQNNDGNNICNGLPQNKMVIETGKKCTVSGAWETEGPISTTVYVSKGELMPAYCGKKVKWLLIRQG